MNEGWKDPQTDEEWQEAVNAAAGALALESARQYGLITGGPVVFIDRCVAILRTGKSKDIMPHVDAVERFLRAVSLQEEIDRS